MTKDELMTLAKEGKAHIEETLTYMVTRYRITGDDADDPETMFVELSEYGVEHAFYTDGEADTELTAAEAEVVRAAIDAAPPELTSSVRGGLAPHSRLSNRVESAPGASPCGAEDRRCLVRDAGAIAVGAHLGCDHPVRNTSRCVATGKVTRSLPDLSSHRSG